MRSLPLAVLATLIVALVLTLTAIGYELLNSRTLPASTLLEL